jgi:hypothetical protein
MATGLRVLPVLHEKLEDETHPQCLESAKRAAGGIKQ